jgi:hypothetical protein
VRQQERELPAELFAAAPDAAAPQVWQALQQPAELPAVLEAEQGLPADSPVVGFVSLQAAARTVKSELAAGWRAQERRWLPGSALVRAKSAVPVPRLEPTTWPPEIMLLCRSLLCQSMTCVTFLPRPKPDPWPQPSLCNSTVVFRIEKLLKFLIFFSSEAAHVELLLDFHKALPI